MAKNIFITGAAGFIGFHAARELHSRGDHIIGYDNFNDYYDPALKRKRQQILKNQGVEIIEGDICDRNHLENCIENHRITHILHLAAQAGVRYSLVHPQIYIQSNVQGFLNILEICRKHPHLFLTYASSSSVYGLNTKIPFSEQDSVDHQASLYAVTKRSNELMAQTYHHLYKIPVTGLRYFTVYGPWGRPDMAYFSFTQDILQGKPLKIFNQGKLQRDFTYIDDIIAGTISAIDHQYPCEIFNLGNHQPVPLLEFIQILEELLEKKAILEYVEMQKGDVLTTYAEISHSQKLLGYNPKTSLKEGLKKFIDWFKIN